MIVAAKARMGRKEDKVKQSDKVFLGFICLLAINGLLHSFDVTSGLTFATIWFLGCMLAFAYILKKKMI